MTRRELIKRLISAVGSWPIAADAQQSSKIVQIGVLSGGRGDRTDASLAKLDALIPALRVFGYVEGQNIAFKPRFADGDTNTLSTLAQELIDGRYKAEVCPLDRCPRLFAGLINFGKLSSCGQDSQWIGALFCFRASYWCLRSGNQ